MGRLSSWLPHAHLNSELWTVPLRNSQWVKQWRHNGRNGISNHQPHDCLLNRLFECRSKKTSKLRVTGLCEGNSPETGEFPVQRASNAENVSIWWHHEYDDLCVWQLSTLPLVIKQSLWLSSHFCAQLLCSTVNFSIPMLSRLPFLTIPTNIWTAIYVAYWVLLLFWTQIANPLWQHLIWNTIQNQYSCYFEHRSRTHYLCILMGNEMYNQ